MGHLLTHLARNADSVVRRLEGAARGEVLDQYEGGLSGRAADIEAGAGRPAAELVSDVRSTAAAVERAMAGLPLAAWDGRSRTGARRGGNLTGRRVLALGARWRSTAVISGLHPGTGAPAPRSGRGLVAHGTGRVGDPHRSGRAAGLDPRSGPAPELAPW